MVASLELQSELLRLFEVVTSMCDHVIEYIESDRAERRVMIETLSELGRVITHGTAAAIAAASPQQVAAPIQIEIDAPAPVEIPPAALVEAPLEWPMPPLGLGERVIGGSMPAGPEPVIDLREPETRSEIDARPERSMTTEIAVEVRGRFGDHWVDGFEICEVMTTPQGPRYRLRRHRDGVVLPELFDATSIRHVASLDQLADDHIDPDRADRTDDGQLNSSTGYWSRS